MTISPPSMKDWEAAWVQANVDALANCYTDSGVVIPPSQATLQGPMSIVDFFKGGMGQINVRFSPEKQIVSTNMVYEFGLVRDSELETEKIIETCHYTIIWMLESGQWKIEFHTWTIPL